MGLYCTACKGTDHNTRDHYLRLSAARVKSNIESNRSNKEVLDHSKAEKPVIPESNSRSNRSNIESNKVLSWRDRNRARYNELQRELMRERRRRDKYDSEEEGT